MGALVLPEISSEQALESAKSALSILFRDPMPDVAHAIALYCLVAGGRGEMNPIFALGIAEMFAAEAYRSGRSIDRLLLAGVNMCLSRHEQEIGDLVSAARCKGNVVRLVAEAADQGCEDAERHLLAVAEAAGAAGVCAAQGGL